MAYVSTCVFQCSSDNKQQKLDALFEPVTTQESAHQKSQSSPQKQKVGQQSAVEKVMLIVFFDSNGLVYQHYMTPKTTINKEYIGMCLKSYVRTFSKSQL